MRGSAMLVATGWLLAGCSTLSSVNPVNWWHRQEGGKIAEQRPPPPGADQPYPNLSTVPAKPAPPDAEALNKLTASLIADRTNAQHAAQSAPLADPSSPAASPSLFGVGTIPPPPPPVSDTASAPTASTPTASAPSASATMPAVNAPPPSASPRKPVQSAPLEQPSSPGPSASAAPNSPVPDLPSSPPTRPAAAGTPPAAPDMPAAMPSAYSGPSATIVFVDGASTLSSPAADEVKAFAAKRGKSTIAVTGFGDATASDPDVQAAAVHLGLLRAMAIVETLKSAGVPENAIHVGAEASGRGAALQLVQ